jgi:hypothetical protein
MLPPMNVETEQNHILTVLSAGEKFNSLLGTFRTSLSVYDWTLEGFKGGVSIPQPSLPN